MKGFSNEGFKGTYFIIVSDGNTLRSISPEALGPSRPRFEEMLGELLPQLRGKGLPVNDMALPKVHAPVSPAEESLMTQGEIARSQGFTGDVCTTCGNIMMKRIGTCLTCQNCGSTTGCA